MSNLIHINLCTPNELQNIINCQTNVLNELERSEFYFPSTPDELAMLFHNGLHNGFIVGAYLKEYLVGFASVERCSGTYYGYHCNSNHIYYSIEDTVVLPKYRGYGTQIKLWKYIIEKLDGAVLLCTIHPENNFSLRNAVALGFIFQMSAKPFGRSQRLILKYEGSNTGNSSNFLAKSKIF